jgi:SAM-dependent methyltransferase
MKYSTHQLRERLRKQVWTSHNIRFSDEITTIPSREDFLTQDLRLLAILRTLSAFYQGDLSGLRVADLGCLEGGFAMAMAMRGADVTAVEARASNLEKARLLKEHFDLQSLHLVLGDVKDFTLEAFGSFDIVLALGILYHLDDPTRWLTQIAQLTNRILIIDSHYAPIDEYAMAQIRDDLKHLGPIERVQIGPRTYEGRWFFEYPEGIDKESQLWASYSNNRSFWLTKESLLQSLCHAGFNLVYEQHDYSSSFYKLFTIEFPRGMYVCLKSA